MATLTKPCRRRRTSPSSSSPKQSSLGLQSRTRTSQSCSPSPWGSLDWRLCIWSLCTGRRGSLFDSFWSHEHMPPLNFHHTIINLWDSAKCQAYTIRLLHFQTIQTESRSFYQCAQNSLTQVVNLPVEVGGAVYN